MKQTTVGVFEARDIAEKAVARVREELRIPSEDISFLYRNTEGEVKEVNTSALLERLTNPVGTTIGVGLILGALLGTVVGLASASSLAASLTTMFAIGPIFEAANLLGAGSQAGVIINTTLVGAAFGLVIGLIVNIFEKRRDRRKYSDEAEPQNIVVAVLAPERTDVTGLLRAVGAFDTHVYRLSI